MLTYVVHFFFFFSSRRRHTRCSRDWSSDVCSSDLKSPGKQGQRPQRARNADALARCARVESDAPAQPVGAGARSEEHTSELQSRLHLVCRLLLEKKKKETTPTSPS